MDDKKRQLELEKRIKTYMSHINAQAPDAASDEYFLEFQRDIQNLSDFVDELYVAREGKYPVFTEEKKTNLIALYNRAIYSAGRIPNAQPGNGQAGGRQELVSYISYLLNKDREAISALDTSCNTDLHTVLDEARSDVVDYRGGEPYKVGEAMSSRIPVEYWGEQGKLRQGFFTKSSQVLSDKEIADTMRSRLDKYPEYRDFFTQLIPKLDFDKLYSLFPYTAKPEDFDAQNFSGDLLLITNDSDQLKPQIQDLSRYKHFRKAFLDISEQARDISHQNAILKRRMGLNAGDNIEDRNVAMSIVAKLTGTSHLLAESTKMKLVINGEEFDGCFMENAPGSDIKHIKSNDPLIFLTPERMDNAAYKKNVSDLQILDFICGNTDRHGGNMLYQFDHHGNLVGIKGIDNDASFPNKDLDGSEKRRLGALPNLNSIKAISAGTANMILNLSREDLKLALRGTKLTEENIDHACNRLNTMQQRIINDLLYFSNRSADFENGQNVVEQGHLRVIPNDKWNSVPLAQLRGNNTFNMIESVTANAYDKYRRQIEKNYNDISLTGGRESFRFNHCDRTGRSVNTAVARKNVKNSLQLYDYELTRMLRSVVSVPVEYVDDNTGGLARELVKIRQAFSSGPEGFSEKSIPELAKSGRLAYDYCCKNINGLYSKGVLNEQETEILNKMLEVQSSLKNIAGELGMAAGTEPLTNSQAHEHLSLKGEKALAEELRKNPPDENAVAASMASVLQARRLSRLPANDLYNPEKAYADMDALKNEVIASGLSRNPTRFYDEKLQWDTNAIAQPDFFFKDYTDEQGQISFNKGNGGKTEVSDKKLAVLAAAYLQGKGYSMDDILDPAKLTRQRQEAGREVYHQYMTLSDEQFADYFAEKAVPSMLRSTVILNDAVNLNPSINAREISKPMNASILQLSRYLNDVGNELRDPAFKKAADARYGAARVEGAIDARFTVVNKLAVKLGRSVGPAEYGKRMKMYSQTTEPPKSYAVLAEELRSSTVHSKWRGSSRAFNAMKDTFDALGTTTDSAKRAELMEKLQRQSARYLKGKEPMGDIKKEEKLSDYAKTRIEFARNVYKFASAGVNAKKALDEKPWMESAPAVEMDENISRTNPRISDLFDIGRISKESFLDQSVPNHNVAGTKVNKVYLGAMVLTDLVRLEMQNGDGQHPITDLVCKKGAVEVIIAFSESKTIDNAAKALDSPEAVRTFLDNHSDEQLVHSIFDEAINRKKDAQPLNNEQPDNEINIVQNNIMIPH